MPERVHTKFPDEPKPESNNAGVLNTPPGSPPLKSKDEVQASQLAQSVESSPPRGLKRSRDGTPKSPLESTSTAQSVTEVSGQTPNGVRSKQPKHAELEEQEQEGVTIKPKTFYGTSHGSANGFSPKRPSIERNTVVKGTSETGHAIQSSPSRVTTNHDTHESVYRSPNLSTDSGSSKGSPMRQRPNPQALKRTKQELEKSRRLLPIWAHKSDIRWGLRKSDILLLIGETGSGKSTQVPQFLITEPWFKRQSVEISEGGQKRKIQVGGMVAVTEPRKLAAISLGNRVAAEAGSYLGKGALNDNDTVGYSVRFDTVLPRKARIKFLTEGMLLQELLHDPHLRNYSAVIIDEIHERSVDVDLLAGFLKRIVRGDRTGRGGIPLKLVIMSATANMGAIHKFFSVEPPLIHVTRPGEDERTDDSDESGHERSGDAEALSRPKVNRINGSQTVGDLSSKTDDSISKSNDLESRRVSDASYSSWDGLGSEDEAAGEQKERPLRHHNGHRPSRLPLPEKANGVTRVEFEDQQNDHVQANGVVVHHIKGQQHPVKIFYTPEPVADYMEAMLKTIFKIHAQEPLPGDILCFLTGQEEIETLRDLVEQYLPSLSKALPKIKVLCLYGHMSNEQQQEAFAATKDKKTRKIVLATNIAETSVTVPGVRFVIDCGKAKVKQYRSRLGLESLLVKPISKSSTIQRKGRAGREAPGKCYRLYTETEYLKLDDEDVPEILRSDVVEAVLRMKARGVQDVMSFPLLDPPSFDALEKALFTLHSIGALDDEGGLSNIGMKMANFPLTAAYSRVLVAAAESHSDCLLEAIDAIACITASNDVFLQPKTDERREAVEEARRDLLRREGDIITYLTTMQKYVGENTNRSEWCEKRMISSRDMKQALDIRRQLREMCLRLGMLAEKPQPDPQPFVPISAERAEVLLKCFMKAFATKTAILQPDGHYGTTLGKNVVAIHPSSVLHGRKMEAILFLEQVYTQKNYARKVNAIQMNWIPEALEMG